MQQNLKKKNRVPLSHSDIVKEMPRSKSGGLDRTSNTGSRRANSGSMRNSAQTPLLPYRKPAGVPGHPPTNRSPRQHTPLNQYVAGTYIIVLLLLLIMFKFDFLL